MRVFNIFVSITICVTCYGRGALPIYDGRLDSDLNANNFSITNLYSLDVKNVPWVTTNQLDAAIASIDTEETDYIALPVINAHLADRDNPHNVTPAQIGAITTNQLDTALEGIVVAESDPLAYPVATNALALASTALQPPATNGLLRAESDTLATVTARGATTTAAVTIGSRGEGDVGEGSFAVGDVVTPSGEFSFAAGSGSKASGYSSASFGIDSDASGFGSFAIGKHTSSPGSYSLAVGVDTSAQGEGSMSAGAVSFSTHPYSFSWQGTTTYDVTNNAYSSHGPGTFNINPVGGLAGFWIGETTLDALLGAKADTNGLLTAAGATNIAAAAVAGSGHAIAEQVVSGAVCTAASGYRYFWTSATNVVLSVNLTSGQVVNLAKLNNTATNSITAIGQVGWEWTGGDMTNTIAAGKSMTFGFLVDAATGKTNAYATGVSK